MSETCKIKNRECPYAGIMKYKGDPIFGESPDWHEETICYNDAIGRNPDKCK